MYNARFEYMVAAGRAAEFEARQRRLLELNKAQPGFQVGVLLNSLGYPTKYARLTQWESPEAARAFRTSEALRRYLQANPNDGISTSPEPQRAYEVIFDVGAPVGTGNPTFFNLIDWSLNAGSAAAFQQNRRDFFELSQKHAKGFVAARLRRFLGSQNRYLVVRAWASRADALAATSIPELQQFNQAHPGAVYQSAPTVAEAYQFVLRA